jgi:uncharacterized membrane protein YecN with MAPEG domain
MILPITLTMAGASTLVNMWLGFRVGQMRRAYKVSIGDGGVEPLVARMRAQANFVENTPFFLILVAGIELAKGSQLWLWVPAALFILARILHAFGMDRRPGNKLRLVGMVTTALILLGLAAYALALAYSDLGRPTRSMTYALAST